MFIFRFFEVKQEALDRTIRARGFVVVRKQKSELELKPILKKQIQLCPS